MDARPRPGRAPAPTPSLPRGAQETDRPAPTPGGPPRSLRYLPYPLLRGRGPPTCSHVTACLLREGVHPPLLATCFGQGRGPCPAHGAERGAARDWPRPPSQQAPPASASGQRLLPARSKCWQPSCCRDSWGTPSEAVCDIWAWDRHPRGQWKPRGWPSPWVHSPVGARVCHIFNSDPGPEGRAVGSGHGGPRDGEAGASLPSPPPAPGSSAPERVAGSRAQLRTRERSGCSGWTPGDTWPLPAPRSQGEDAFSGTPGRSAEPRGLVTASRGRPCPPEGADAAST